jgi:hypothetical protein
MQSWSIGRNVTPENVIADLRRLYEQIEKAAAEQCGLIEELSAKHGAPDIIELKLAANDEVAQARGWPCTGAQAAVYGLAIALTRKQFRITS